MVSQQLAQHWRIRLAEWQQRLEQGRPRPWLARAYVRVLSFLLKQYAGDSSSEPLAERTDEDPFEVDRSPMHFFAAGPDDQGKPPRSGESIRSVLEAVKAKVPQVEHGPLAGGLHADDPIVLASFYRRGLAAGLVQDLQKEGIDAQSAFFRRQSQVIVRAGDLQRAKPIVAMHASFARDSSRWRRQRAGTFVSVGALSGTLLGAITAVVLTAAMGDLPVFLLSAFFFSALFGPLLALVGFFVGTIVDG